MMFFLIRFRLFFLVAGSMKDILPSKPLFFNASAYIGFDLLNSSLLQDIEESLSVIFIGRCLITTGGWFDLAFTYKGLLFGLRYGQYFPDGRSNVTSRKSVCKSITSIVIPNPHDLKTRMISFLALSACFLVRDCAVMPSSLYKPTSFWSTIYYYKMAASMT